MKKFKQARQLPSRAGLNDIGKTQRTIIDYSKASPITPREPSPAILQALRKAPR